MTTLNVMALCQRPESRETIRKIRQWCRETSDSQCCGVIRRVDETWDLSSALDSIRKRPDESILVTVGLERSQIDRLLKRHDARQLEIVPLSPEQNYVPALRKSILKLRTREYASIRPLESAADFRAYFSLRYQVWKSLNYIPPDKHCPESQWELDYTDRTAFPIGAFSKEGVLIGCARLVRGLGQEVPCAGLIQALVAEKRDPKLIANLRYPVGLVHPFDVLESFVQFREYYRALVKNNRRKAEASRVIVQPEFRCRGLGEVLVDSLISLAVKKQIDVLFLACRKEHQRFYERCGFRVIKEMECESFVNVNVPSIAMDCQLRVRAKDAI